MNVENSTVDASEIWMDDGVLTSTVTVTLETAGGYIVSGEPVYIQVTGSNNSVNGDPVGDDEWVLIGNSGDRWRDHGSPDFNEGRG